MNEQQAKHILEQLASGIDPRNSNILTSIDVIHHPDVIRALFIAVNSLSVNKNLISTPQNHLNLPSSKEPVKTKPRTVKERQAENIAQGLPANRSLPWEEDATSYLINAYEHGEDMTNIAQHIGRTVYACINRLVVVGKITQDTGVHLQQEYRNAGSSCSNNLTTEINPFSSGWPVLVKGDSCM